MQGALGAFVGVFTSCCFIVNVLWDVGRPSKQVWHCCRSARFASCFLGCCGLGPQNPSTLKASSPVFPRFDARCPLRTKRGSYFMVAISKMAARCQNHTEVLESKPPKPSFLLLLPGARPAAVLRLGPLGLSLPFFFSRCSRSRATNVYGDFAKSQDFKAKGCRSWCFGACGMLGVKLRGVMFLCAGNAWRFWVFGIEEFGLQNAC